MSDNNQGITPIMFILAIIAGIMMARGCETTINDIKKEVIRIEREELANENI